MLSFGFEDQVFRLIAHLVCEIESDAFGGRDPKFNPQHVVVTSGGFVPDAALDDWEDAILGLPLQKRDAKMPKEFAARSLEQIQISRVINVIADGAVGIRDAMRVKKFTRGHEAQCASRPIEGQASKGKQCLARFDHELRGRSEV